MTNCSAAVQSDITQVNGLAEKELHPLQLEKVQENLYLRHFAIKKDQKNIVGNYTSKDFFDSGKATATLFQHLFHHNLPIKSIPFFLAGFLSEFVGDNHLVNVETCWKGGKNIEQQIIQASDDIGAGNKTAAILMLKEVAAELP